MLPFKHTKLERTTSLNFVSRSYPTVHRLMQSIELS